MADGCGCKCEVWSRVSGYMRPVADWNAGKREEFKERRLYKAEIGKTKVKEAAHAVQAVHAV